MSQSLRVLLLEDSVIDADLVIRELRRAGYVPDWTRVETKVDFVAALGTSPDLILSDYSLPHFDGVRALQLLRERGLDTPFILISGTIGEDAAVEAMKLGATDYLLKDRITRLGSAVERALEEKRQRDERRRAGEELGESEERLRLALEGALRLQQELEVHKIELEMQNGELRAAQAEAETSLERFTELYDFAPVGYFNLARDGTIRQVNLTGTRLVGTERSRLLGRRFELLVVAHYRRAFRGFLAQVFANEGARVCELTLAVEDRTPLEIHLEATRSWDGRECRAVLIDITARKRAEAALRESEERLRLALHAAHLGTFDWDVPHNRIIWSRWHEELWGFQPGEFAGTYEVFAGRVHPDDLPGINAEVARCIAAREPFLREFRVVWPDGSVHWIAGRGEFTFDEGGQPGRMRGVVREITARKQAEGALRISDLALKAVSQGVVITGPDQLITSVNAAFVAITGYPTNEILGRNCRFLKGPDTNPATVAAIRAALGGSGDFAGEILNYRRDGTPFWNDLTISAVRDEASRPSHFIGITRDITRRKLAEQGLARVSRLYVVLSRINEMIVRTSEATALFEGACRIAVEQGRFSLAAIFGMDGATDEVRPLAHFGAELGYFREMRVNLADPNLNQGTIGTAIRTGRYDVCNDFAKDARMGAWQSAMARRGFRSGASFPIRHGKDIFGALVLFSAETGIFEDEEIKLLTAVADDVSFAIEAMDREGKRKRAEAALRESEVTMATAQQIAHLGSWELDLTGEEIDANPLRWSDEMFRIAGFVPGAVRVTNDLFFSLIPPDEQESIRQAVAAAIREHGQYFLVHRLIRPDGTTRIVHEMAQVTYDGQTGRPLKLVGTAHDITERKQAEDERDRLFNMSLDLLCVASFDGRFEQVNPAWTACLGWTAEELTARPMNEFILPEDHEMTARIRARVQQGEPIRGFENRYRAKDGSHRWLSWSVHPMVEFRRVFSVARDVTERKRTEESLRKLAEQVDAERIRLVDAQAVAKVGSWETDAATLAVSWSAEAYRIFGTSPERFQPSHAGFLAFVHPEDRAAVDRAFAESLAHGRPCEIEHRIVLPGGRVKHIQERWRSRLDAAGRPLQAVGTCQDITERKEAEEALRSSREQLRAFAQRLQVVREEERAAIAREIHDVLAQELTRLRLDLAWLRRRVARPVDEPTRAELDKKVASMLELTEISIESVQKLATDLRPVLLDSLGLGPAIEWLAEDFSRRTGIPCTAAVAADLPPIERAGATALFRIVQESLTNVVRHARAAHVEVALAAEGGQLRLTIQDDGRGITPEELADPRSIGLLGLRERAALLGGETEILPGPGGGTLVRVTTPLATPVRKAKK